MDLNDGLLQERQGNHAAFITLCNMAAVFKIAHYDSETLYKLGKKLAEAPGSRTQPPRVGGERPILKTGRATGPRSLPNGRTIGVVPE